MSVHEDRAAEQVLAGSDGTGQMSCGAVLIGAVAFIGMEIVMLPQPGKGELRGTKVIPKQEGPAPVQAGLAAGTPHPRGREPAGMAPLSPAAPS